MRTNFHSTILQTIRENDTQLKLLNFIIDNFVPEEVRN
jgi:hypothetical protein